MEAISSGKSCETDKVCRGFMKYVPICILAVFAAGFGATTMLYKRREK